MVHPSFEFIVAAGGLLPLLKHAVVENKLHPILVNFTAALVPVSLGSDLAGRAFRNPGLRSTAWWTLCFATVVTPFTAVTGWLFWMPDDSDAAGMSIHKWLGTGFVLLLALLALWRFRFHKHDRWPNIAYLLVGLILGGALAYQGHLGGTQSFGGIEASAHSEEGATPSMGMTRRAAPNRDHQVQWRDHIDL